MDLIKQPIPIELFTNFNKIKYYDEPHKYYIDDKQLISVTTIIHKYENEFNEDYWAEYKANQFNLTPDEIKRAWKFINKKGTIKGSLIHDYAENLALNKEFEYPKHKIIKEFGFDPIINEYNLTKKHVDKFNLDSKNKLIPIKTECVIYDEESLISGMFDILYYNVKADEFQIWDNKTNKKLSLNSNDKLLNELSDLDDCDLEIYSLQLGLYKYIIEKNTNIKLGDSYIVWFSHLNDDYKIIKCHNRENYIKTIVNNRINELKLVA